ncbi:MAG: hypothetical protein MUE34_02330 [Acidimicrobiales bacterium]|jgi:hypothetical protein|nr:hypothetical protein [Acidimicrobiales bacterium]
MSDRGGSSLLVRVVVGALALFGAVVLVQWVLAGVFGLLKSGLAIVVLVAAAAAVLSAKGRR